MTTTLIVLSTVMFVVGSIAVYYWYKASKVMVKPMWEEGGTLVEIPMTNHSKWLTAIYIGTEKAGRLNKIAARWTAVSVMLSAVVSLISSLGCHGT